MAVLPPGVLWMDPSVQAIHRLLQFEVNRLWGGDGTVAEWQDECTTTHGDVLEVWRKAARRAGWELPTTEPNGAGA